MKQKTFTTFAIAKMLGVYPSTIANWVDSGKLKAFSTPGGHRRVLPGDLKTFLKLHDMPFPAGLTPEEIKILVVDDDPSILELVTGFLKSVKKGYKVFTAVDGFEAGRLLGQHDPHLVILDLKLPGIDGFEVCRQIKEQHSRTRVLAITGYDNEENRQRIMKAGADAYLGKPFRMGKFLEECERLLSLA
ncbi:response regulator [candidate division TA06 bacterium]|nr:response regulator [candidate division TA06 bacterium]